MADALWTWDALVAAAHGQADGSPAEAIAGFSIDTRSLAPGDVFVALKDQRDGHDFVTAAFENGAAAALVSRDYRRGPGDGALLRVDDTLRALERIGVAARARLKATARVLAVTGSAGKTGTKEMLRACLATVGKVHAPDKSFNNHWGVPLTLARMPADVDFAIFEIGMNHAGEITPLTKMVRPHIAVVTNVLPVHVGNFPDGEIGVANAKAEIFEGLEPGGIAILPVDSPHFERLRTAADAKDARVLTFGGAGHADISGSGEPDAGGVAQIVTATLAGSAGHRTLAYAHGTPGAHIALNSLAVVLALDCLGCLSQAALSPMRDIGPPRGRGERTAFAGSGVLLIDESYNANPRSMAAAIAVLGDVPRDRHARRIAVIGDMLELGEPAADFHRGLKPVLERARVDLVFACGPNMKLLFDSLPADLRGEWGATSAEIVTPVVAALREGDVVMVKGSLGSRMAPIVEAIKQRFSPVTG
ncbi:MAG: UDP-N-acetylmuramoyl-tripeptide--D-alanyl-D-alanine ligase [Hyphomicrobiaceae bacterium]